MERDSDHGYEKEIECHQESWLERKNLHLERMLEKANNEKNMLRHMAYHYLARIRVCKVRMRILKAKLRKASRR